MEKFDLLNNDLQISPAVQNFLSEAAKWAKFLSVIGFIFCGLIVIAAFFVPSVYSTLSTMSGLPTGIAQTATTTISVIYFILATFLFFPCLFLNKFSVKMRIALNSVSQENFEESLKNLKSLLKFYGISTIILLTFYVLIFILTVIGIAVKA